MSAKSEHRYQELNHRQIDAKLLTEENLLERSIDRFTHEQELEIERLNAEVNRLTSELEHTKQAYQRRNAELALEKEERQTIDRQIRNQRAEIISLRKSLADTDFSWRKLSAIVRLALTPEKYHEYRTCVEQDNPEFIRPKESL